MDERQGVATMLATSAWSAGAAEEQAVARAEEEPVEGQDGQLVVDDEQGGFVVGGRGHDNWFGRRARALSGRMASCQCGRSLVWA